jgi:hypothetical protein
MGMADKPPAKDIVAHARALLLSGATDRDTALRGLLAIAEKLRGNFKCPEQEVRPIAELIAELKNPHQLPPS